MSLSLLHKFSSYLHKKKVPVLPKVIYFVQYFLYNSSVPATVRIGKNTKFAYGGIGLVIHARAVIGSGCVIGQGITIGGKSKQYNVPIIGNNVYLGPGCRIIGPIHIGDDVVIGPNSVVVTDIPSGSIVVGIPGKVIREGIKMSDYV